MIAKSENDDWQININTMVMEVIHFEARRIQDSLLHQNRSIFSSIESDLSLAN